MPGTFTFNRSLWLRTIAYSIPLLFFLFIEAVLWLVGFGTHYPMVLTDEHNTDYQYINPKLSLRYFDSEEFATQTQYDVFLKHKTEHTFRIIVLGESTAAGFPYSHGASFPRILEHRLQMRYPEKNVEVINASLAATNTYTLLDISDEVLRLKPDLVIVSAGHNEYYGALGVGSTQMLSKSRRLVQLYLNLKRVRLVQLIRSIVIKLRSSSGPTDASEASTLMQKMVGEKSIPLESALYEAGVRQFSGNVEQLLRFYKRNGIPVWVTGLVSNYKDQPPFVAGPLLSPNGEQVLDEVRTHLQSNDPEGALQSLEVLQQDSSNALVQFYRGKVFLQKGDSQKARKYFAMAKDLDGLRFRAPEVFNDILKSKADEHGVLYIDMPAVFEQYAKDGVVGNELLTEHVHPNLTGYRLMAGMLLEAVSQGFFGEESYGQSVLEKESPQALATEVDSLYGTFLVLRLKSSWPFKLLTPQRDSLEQYFKPANLAEQLAFSRYLETMQWVEAVNRLHDYHRQQRQPGNALIASMALAQEFNHFFEPNLMAAQNAEVLKKINLALYFYKKAGEIKKSPDAIIGAARMSVTLGKYEDARGFVDELVRTSPSPMATLLLQSVVSLPGLIERHEKNPQDLKTLEDLASAWILFGQYDKGTELLNEILAIDPDHAVARNLMKNIQIQLRNR